MSITETPTVDCVRRVGGSDCHRSHSSKRKLDDCGPAFNEDDANAADFLVRLKKNEPIPVNSSSDGGARGAAAADRVSDARSALRDSASRSESTRSLTQLQFFVRMMPKGNTVVMHASPQDKVKSIHQRIEKMTRIPVWEQGLIYRGKQLQLEHTLHECGIQNDVNLQLVGRMRSTEYPQAWQVMDSMVFLICRLCKGEAVQDASKTINGFMTRYLNLPSAIEEGAAAAYFQILLASDALSMLVMLYVSPYVGNKDHAEFAVKHFLGLCRSSVPKKFYGQCARVLLLELCTLLRRLGCDDPLYLSCRSTLGALLENAGVSLGCCSSGGFKGGVLLQDICPFVNELVNRLMRDLDESIVCPNSSGPLLSDVQDFTAFLTPLRNAISERRALNSSLAEAKCSEVLLPQEEGDYLHLIYMQLLSKMDECLHRMEEYLADKERGEWEVCYSAWSQYLSILKELYRISKLYDGAEDKFWGVLMPLKSMLSLLIIRYAKRTEDHQWILEHKCVTNFESRRHLTMMLFPDVKEDYEELHEMLIDRSQLLVESFEYIARAEPESLHAGLFMEFKNEEATGPGVLREWFLLVCQDIFNPQNALFVACPKDRRRFYPNHASKVHNLHLDYFSFSGRVIALALMHRVQVGIVFDRVFFMQLAGRSINLEDIRDADPYMYSSCKQILEMDADFIDSDALGLTFVREVEELGSRKVIELCPDGKSLAVNSKNREKYVDLLIQNCFVTSISEQVSHFAKGFADILSNSRLQQFFFQSLELEDLDWMLHGNESTISVEDWKAHTEYHGYTGTDCQISWFWEIVEGMSAEQRKILLFFWTSVKYLPVEGFRGLASRLYIYRSLEPDDRLPSSHTCFFRICFPAYSSKAVMQDRLGVITQEHIGCSFGTW